MKRIIYIILLAMGLAAVAPMASLVDNNVAAVYAADARAKAKAQREKEKAKLQKEREKAKAKAAKEREKKKKEQAKAAAQKQKAREKAKAQQAKAKQSSASNKQVASKPAAPKVDNSLSAAEEKAQYMEQIAAIDKANAKAEAYNNRDIAHRLGFWGQVGYSNLFTSSIAFDDQAMTGFQNKDKGFVGGGLGLGYQLRYKQFLMTVGAEFNTYNSIMGVSNQPDGSLLRSFGMEPYAATMTYTYAFSKMQDKLIGFLIQQILFPDDRFHEIDQEKFDLVVNRILSSENVYIVGMRTSTSLSSFLGSYLKLIRKNVFVVQDTMASEVFEQLIRIGKNDLFIGISFPRYSKHTVDAMTFSKSRGAYTVAITDGKHSPCYDVADICLFAKSDMVSFLDSLVAPMSLINALIVAVGSRSPDNSLETFKQLEHIWEEYDVYETYPR